MFSTSASVFGPRDTIMNGLEAYSVTERIGDGNNCIVYRVTCKIGRLRNRELALKRLSIATPPPPPAQRSLTPSIHQTLHHPNIVSLFSSFSSPLGHFYVLELCSAGTLQDFLHSRVPPRLLEDELRGVIKSVCDALTYLRKEVIVHRDIKPSRILLTGDYRVKLSGFNSATRLHSIDPSVQFARDPFGYTAPEALSNTTYDFSVDVWSVGCVMVTCLSGASPFPGGTIPEVLERMSRAEYTLPPHLLSDTERLIARMLHIQPENRIHLPNILSHPFLASPATLKPLRPTKGKPPPAVQPHQSAQEISRRVENQLPLFPPRKTFPRRLSRHSSVHCIQTPSVERARVVLGDIANTELRALLQNEISTSITSKKPHFTAPTRRIVSDPVPRKMGILVTESRPLGSHSDIVSEQTPASSFPPISDDNLTVKPPAELSGMNLDCRQRLACTTDISNTPHALPVGTTRPIQFNTTQLNSQTHKTTFGQITILPSRSVLVDFREGQRRRGLKGDEVFVVDSYGVEISVYSAPHLSSPCCLVEPTQQFSVHTLPSEYWKQYNDASRLINQIKQRTPKLVLYTTEAKCTLMANTPQGDIELIFGGSPGSGSNKGGGHHYHDKNPFMRIRLSRQFQSLELAQHLSGVRGEEWTKKSLPSMPRPPYVSPKDWSSLNKVEQEAMHQLAFFIRNCEALESMSTEDDMNATSMDHTSTVLETPANSQQDPPIDLYSAPKISTSLSSINILPRPRFSAAATPRSGQDSKEDDKIWQKNKSRPASDASLEVNLRSKLDEIDPPATWFANDLDVTHRSRGIQTRFIPLVGWCIRYGSSVSQGGRYRIMFLDGVALDIDVDEDWVEFKSRSGETTRHNIRDCNLRQKIGERMKVFEEFVSLFDDSQQESMM